MIFAALCCGLATAWTAPVFAQQPGVTTPGATGIAPVPPPPTTTVPLASPPATLQTPALGGTTYDPYSGGAAQPPTLYGSPGVSAQQVPGGYGAPPGTQPYGAYPQYPPTANPNGMFVDPNSGMPYQWAPPMKLFQNLRLRYTWIPDDGDPKVAINDFDINTTMLFPNFLWSGQPLMVTPSFALHLWSGPQASSPADLPSKAYSAYLDFGWTSNPANAFGVVLGARVGIFSDFDTVTSDSVRTEGLGLLTYRLSHTSTIKGGVVYLDRNEVGLWPAGGWMWTPNPQTRFDIFFPQPKFAQFMSTVGTTDVWWYIAAEYGGGNWTVVRDSGLRDSVDINDVRIILGFEWLRGPKQVGAIEIGWVTNRELVYRDAIADNIKLSDSFMLRAEVTY